jgi:ATP-dependent DNA helicase RecQ
MQVLRLGRDAWPVLKGEKQLLLREERKAAPKAREKASRKKAAAGDLWAEARGAGAAGEPAPGVAPSPTEERLFEALRALRRTLADEQKVPAYVVFHDSTLRAIAARAPRSLDELARVPGIGETKLARYGGAVLAVVREALGEGTEQPAPPEIVPP